MARSDKMKTINKERLKYAREHYGLSIDDVASKNIIKRDILENIERGDDYPTYSQLSRLSEFYNRPLLFFFFRNDPPQDKLTVAFRSVESEIGNKLNMQIRTLMEKADIYRLNLSELYNGQSVPQFQQLLEDDSIKNDSTLSTWLRNNLDLSLQKQKERFKRAEQLIEYLREKLYDIGIYIFKDSFRDDTVSGLCLYDEKYPIILLNNKTTFNRQLFTIFHEIYHLYHKEADVYLNRRGAEKACDKFAGQFLIPDKDLEERLVNVRNCEDYKLIEILSNEYTVSKEAISYRLLSKHYISENFYMEIRDDGIRKMNAESSGGNFYFTRMSYLGKPYLKQVFAQYYRGIITATTVAKYTGLKTAHVAKLSSYTFGGEF